MAAWKAEKDLKKHLKTLNKNEKKELERKKQLQEEEEGLNILGPELYELIFGRLSFKIKLSNIKIYFENDSRVPRGINTVNHPFSIMVQLKGFQFNSEDI